MLAGSGHSRSALNKWDYLVPRKARPPFGPNRRWVPAYARGEAPRLAHIQLDSYTQWFIVPAFVQSRFRMSSVLFWFTLREETREGPPTTARNDRVPSGRAVGFVNGRLAFFFFFALVLCPEEEKMKLLCFTAHRFAAEPLCALNAFCRILQGFSLWEWQHSRHNKI